MTAKGGDTDIDLNGSLNKQFFRDRGLTINFDGDRPGSSMFNEGDTLKKTKDGKVISTKATALDFSAGNNKVVDQKHIKKLKSSTPSMDHMMGTITGSTEPNYKKSGKTTSERGRELLKSRHAKGFNSTRKSKQAKRKAGRNFSKLGNSAPMGKIQTAVTKPESAGPIAPKGKRGQGMGKGKGLGKIRQQERQDARQANKVKPKKDKGKGKGLGKIRQQERQAARQANKGKK